MDALLSATPPSSTARRLVQRASGLLFGLALPTGFLTWVLGFDAIKQRINGRVWCRDAREIVFDVTVRSSGSTSRISDALVCRKDGTVLRTIGDVQMMATNIGVAFAISLVLLLLLFVGLKIYSWLRRLGAAD
jgi:hypothetical protein